MLQAIREHTQGWIAGVIITIIILTFALWGIHSYFTGNANNTVVAEVNGTEIAKEQLAVAYERLRRQTQIQYGSSSPDSKNESALKSRALQALIDLEVLKQASIQQGFQITNSQIDNYLQNMPDFQVDGQFSMERFQEILSSTMLSTGEFLDLIKTSLLIDQPKLGIILTSFALPDETDYTISLVNQERDIEYISIPASYFLAKPIVISADKIKAYYDQHQSEFMTPEQMNVEYMQLSLKDLYATFNPSDAMLKTTYNENINAYTQPTTWKLDEILIPTPDNATPDQIAKAQSLAATIAQTVQATQDFSKFSSQYGVKGIADQGFLTLNKVPTELQKTVATMTKPNQISDPIKTSQGFVILKLLDMQEPKIQAFDAVKDKVKETYIHQHAEEKFTDMREQLANVTYEHPDSLQLASKQLGLPVQTSELFTKDKPGKDISQYKKVRDMAFSNDVMNLQNNSDVIQINPETVIVIRVKSHVASTLLPLSDISKQIEDKLKAEQAEKQAQAFAQDFLSKLKTTTDPVALAKSYQFTWNQAGLVGRYDKKVDPAILDTAFQLSNPSNNNHEVYGDTRLANGYAIIGVKSVKSGVADAKQNAIFAEQMQNSEGVLEYELYKQSQTKNAKVVIPQ